MPISYHAGVDLAKDTAEILVNTVNTVGTMGKGLALAMKQAFPEILEPYQAACSSGRLKPGGLQILPTKDGRRVVNLASKEHWRAPSRPEWVGYGLFALNSWLCSQKDMPRSIALPLPGAGNGGLSPELSQQLARIYLQPAASRGCEIRIMYEELEPAMFPHIYAGVGSRETPDDVGTVMTGIAERAAEDGWLLRSGGATGADTFFERGASRDMAEIYLAKRRSGHPHGIVAHTELHNRLVEKFHPAPRALSPFAYELMSRNGCQVFGRDFTRPVSVLCCWTEGGRGEGGTGQAVRLANAAGIPVLDLGDPNLQGISASEAYTLMRVMAEEWRQQRGFPEPERDGIPEFSIQFGG